MAKAGYSAAVGAAVALAAATPKSILSVIAPSQFGVDLKKVRISFDGVTASAAPVLVEIVSFTTDGTGTAGTVNQIYGRTVTPGFTSKYNYSAEPTTPTVIDRYTLTPNGGLAIYDWPLGDSPDCAASSLIAVRCTAPAIVNANATLWFERC
ncbi:MULTISPECIES: hypothetical protein [Protofrankia]|uniref:SipW-cognate class signal peptide n=1 Tax=Protofrankia coriariae TaxID=1562887 RepID=A0ABR5F4H2_9ACTN|nr:MULTISPECIES: hypothetical protein [Protofrankia]KLL11580.1 hypothetical protein FrCorBMG51_11135 [Protofrankia coriariae]ONH35716.1 hypothetical protein BL254_10530 [Protofrankia sp. BMG5.30]